jgi:integrase
MGQRKARVIGKGELKLLKHYIATQGSLEHKVAFQILHDTGIRVGDLINLLWIQFDSLKREIYFVPKKTQRSKPLPITIRLSVKTVECIREYFKYLQRVKRYDEYARILPMSERNFDKITKKWKKEANLSRDLMAHDFRKTFITRIYELPETKHDQVVAQTGISFQTALGWYNEVSNARMKDLVEKLQ